MCKIILCIDSHNHIFFVTHIVCLHVFSVVCIKVIPAEAGTWICPGILQADLRHHDTSTVHRIVLLVCHLFPQMLLGHVSPLGAGLLKVHLGYIFIGHGSIFWSLLFTFYGFVWTLSINVILSRLQDIVFNMCVLWHLLIS